MRARWQIPPVIGAIFLLSGTSIGAGMLALPVALSNVSYPLALVYTIATWALTYFTALLILEVNLLFPPGGNLISMAKLTLGRWGQIIAWICYLSLLYTLLCAYVAGGGEIVTRYVLQFLQWPLTEFQVRLLFVMGLGFILYHGVWWVGNFNGVLMTIKLMALVVLITLMLPHLDLTMLKQVTITQPLAPLMILLTAFGSAVVIPSLRVYLEDDVVALRRVILIGTLIPLTAYLLWITVMMGVVPLDGQDGLLSLYHKQAAITTVMQVVQAKVHSPVMHLSYEIFLSITMFTAFLGVSLALIDFLADGLQQSKKGWRGFIILVLALFPPLWIVTHSPHIFIQALDYAGVLCVILLLFLPIAMAWRVTYHPEWKLKYQVIGGRWSLALALLASALLFFVGVQEVILSH